MWIQVRSMDGKKTKRLDGLSKLTKIEELRELLVEDFEAPVERQKLFFRGKMLVDGHSLFDYDVSLDALIQLMVTPVISKPSIADDTQEKMEEIDPDAEPATTDGENGSEDEDLPSTYKLGDVVDCRDEIMGSWFEAKLVKVTRRTKDDKQPPSGQEENTAPPSEEEDKENVKTDANMNDKPQAGILVDKSNTNNKFTDVKEKQAVKKCPFYGMEDDGFVYHIIFDGYEGDDIVKLPVRHMRPRARHNIPFSKVAVGDQVLLNYNYDEPDTRGYWYDAVVTGKRDTRTIKELLATVYIGKDHVPFENCQVLYRNELFRIEQPGMQLNVNEHGDEALSPSKRAKKPDCDVCQDNPRRKCKECSCARCGDKKDPEQTLMCDECDQAYHLYCLKPPLTELPSDDEWYCPECKVDDTEVVRAGEKLKQSKKKSKMASAKGDTTRDWGKGMACMGRSKQCTIVKVNHFGPIPGVHVGQMWKFRVQVSEAGVHRPHVAGISGRAEEGSYSLVLSGGYEDDVDNGDEFTYTGSGGRDLSGNKRTAEQSMDQELTRTNRALAKNCDASIDDKKGATAKDWRKGKPIRVVRNCKGAKHSEYAPEEGNRYDGIYKMVKYWPDKGKSGFIVWRYKLRRDDPDPAPWTKAGQKRSAELGLKMEYPPGYLEKEEAKRKEREEKEMEKADSQEEDGETPAKKEKSTDWKRVESSSEEEEVSPAAKKSKKYVIPADTITKIKADTENEKAWEEAIDAAEGIQEFLKKIEELFSCNCCLDLVLNPITTSCKHNICKSCLQRSFKASVFTCSACREDLGEDHPMDVNKPLATALETLFPGYQCGR